eukprot:GAHX01004981.1.p1 GENE.GAHX01004981.1~~GAHX01004981.1.p1  ORF type:complete len:88 (-),score=2.35 GAHX01004981.1:341-604(-)
MYIGMDSKLKKGIEGVGKRRHSKIHFFFRNLNLKGTTSYLYYGPSIFKYYLHPNSRQSCKSTLFLVVVSAWSLKIIKSVNLRSVCCV